ncbi:MAG: hypothetical protein RL266_2184 [Bacteroidota bacterium]
MMDILNATKLKSDVDVLAEAIASDLLNGDKNQRAVRIRKLNATISKQQERITRLQDNPADGIISSTDYLEMKSRYSAELDEARKKLIQLESHDGEKEELIKSAISSLNSLSKRYSEVDANGKLKLVGSIFPEMIEFDGIKCRTPRINQAARLCFNVDAALGGKRKGTIHPKLELSPVVTL